MDLNDPLAPLWNPAHPLYGAYHPADYSDNTRASTSQPSEPLPRLTHNEQVVMWSVIATFVLVVLAAVLFDLILAAKRAERTMSTSLLFLQLHAERKARERRLQR